MDAGEPESKRAKMDHLPEHLEFMGEEGKKSLIEIDEIQSQIDALNENASEEVLKIEEKYNNLRAPHYEKRSSRIKNIPRFWTTALLNHPQLSQVIEEKDMEVVQAVTNLEVDESGDIKQGYTIRFFFGNNSVFENDKIEKQFLLGDNPTCTTTAIKWLPGKAISRGVRELEPITFTEWLTENVKPGDEISEIIKDDLWPNPVQYFLCPELNDGDDFDELLDEEGEGDELEDDGDDDQDDGGHDENGEEEAEGK